MKNYFEDIWNLHYQWGKGVLYNEVKETGSVKIISSPIPGEYYNFTFPTGDDPLKLNLNELKKEFDKSGNKLAFFIPEKQQHLGFDEYLIRNWFKFEASDCWVGYNPLLHINHQINSDIKIVDSKNFNEYDKLLSEIFDFPGNEKYMEIMKNIIGGKLKLNYPGLQLELYLVYDNGIPVSGAGLFYSKQGNFAYLHDAGTLEKYRGKGYQSDLIKFRVNKSLENGIDRIYSSVDSGGKSWSNCIKCGFDQLHTGHIFR